LETNDCAASRGIFFARCMGIGGHRKPAKNRTSRQPSASPCEILCEIFSEETMTDTAASDRVDMLFGVDAIADFLGIKRRAAEHLVESDRIPYFKLGRKVCASRTEVRAAIEREKRKAEQERVKREQAKRDFMREPG
jgi:excisionase family DNA binding protein